MSATDKYQLKLKNIHLEMAGVSDIGCKRDNNEDYVQIIPDHGLCVLADGMGGHLAGEVASRMAVEGTIEQICKGLEYQDKQRSDISTALPLRRLMKAAIVDTNSAITIQAENNATQAGMGTTIVALLFRDNWFVLGNVGDSRGYRLRDGELRQLSVDHSYVQDMVKRGMMSQQDASVSPKRGLLTQALGNPDVDPSFTSGCPLADDCFLLCSDGLTEVVSDKQIKSILKRYDKPAEAVEVLIEKARKNGGPDNITVCVVRVRDEDDY
jgi:protein phosphatase